jgi:hypothetical protein
LATVLGTVANGLRSALTTQRYEVTLLLGRLFAESNLAEDYAACFREWLGHRLDVDPNIRVCVVKQSVAILMAVSTKRAPGLPTVDPEIALVGRNSRHASDIRSVPRCPHGSHTLALRLGVQGGGGHTGHGRATAKPSVAA